MRPMFRMGEAVVFQYDGKRTLGEVVGMVGMGQATFYDISLEELVVKAIEQSQLSLAPVEDARAVLMAMLAGAHPVASAREALLRQRYVAFLSRVVDERTGAIEQVPDELSPRFEVGQEVSLKQDETWLYGVIRGVALLNERLEYEVEAAGELIRAQEDLLRALDDEQHAKGIRLGQRMRFVAPGFEDDDAYCGVVCVVDKTEDEITYSLMFDDGDVIEGLSALDLAPC